MIYCVWYPSGGFGHFINSVLSLYGENFVRPQGSLNFSSNGNSHSLDLVVPKYYHNSWPYHYEFDSQKNYSVLIDNGINDETDAFKVQFPDATVIKICYTDWSWPVVAQTMITKAMKSNIETELSVDQWAVDQPWAKREKYFLFLRDHPLRQAWRPGKDHSINIEQLFDYHSFYNALTRFENIAAFETLWRQWTVANSKYLLPVQTADIVMKHIERGEQCNLRHITDIWDQAVIYYYFWIKFGIEVPHNDFENWIDSTDQLSALL